MARYEVIVGNIGRVYYGNTFKTAVQDFNDYCVTSKNCNTHRAHEESVTIFKDGEPMPVYDYTGYAAAYADADAAAYAADDAFPQALRESCDNDDEEDSEGEVDESCYCDNGHKQNDTVCM